MADLCYLIIKRRLLNGDMISSDSTMSSSRVNRKPRHRSSSTSVAEDSAFVHEVFGTRHLRRSRSSSTKGIDSTIEKTHYSLVKLNTVLILSIVFLLGALSAILLTVWRTDSSRKGRFQPLPLAQHLQVFDESEILDTPSRSFPAEGWECEGDNALGLELDAISSIHAALDMKSAGKLAKAKKLFQHAMALCPRHPDVLTYYGEFFEDSDVLLADQLYVQALTFAPTYSRALVNRKRTLPLVEEIDEKTLSKIDEKRDMLDNFSEIRASSLNRIRKEAYFQQLYHSAGIEGNTLTLSQTRMIIETRMAVGGKSIQEHNEILGLDEAMKFINTSLVNRIGNITIDDILTVHKHVMAFVDPSEAGQLRKTQVYVGSHVPPAPGDLSTHMNQLIEWLNSDDALSLHPIHYAAIFHYKVVFIHPFLDGNGRTSRLLMNWVLMQSGYPPVIIPKHDRHFYYDHLDTANKGDVRPFIRFIAHCAEKTLDAYLWATQEHPQYLQGPDISQSGDEPES